MNDAIADIKKVLKDAEDFYPLREEGHELDQTWDVLCEHTIDELSEVPVDTKPATEQALFKCQSLFYKERGSDEAIGEMFQTMIPYASSLILKTKRNSRFITKEALHTMASEVSLRVCSQFLRRPGFTIKASFAGYIKWKILEVTGEADDFERADQLDPLTKKRKKMPLLSLSALTDRMRDNETSIEDMQEKLGFVSVGGAPVERGVMTPSLKEDQVVSGVVQIINTLFSVLNQNAKTDMHAYRDTLYTATALYILIAYGIQAYTSYRVHCPTVRLGRQVDATTQEIAEFLRDSAGEEDSDVQ